MNVPLGWSIENTKSGDPTVVIDGVALHSRYDPVREAEKLAATVPRDVAIVVLGGLGLGYVAEALTRSAPDRFLVVAEADETLPHKLMAVRDITPLLENPKVSILAGGNPRDIASLLSGGPVGSAIHLIQWQPSVKINPEWYNELKLAVVESARRRQVNSRTLDRFGRLWVRNLAVNVSRLHEALSLEPWRESFIGIPALVLAGGPSLENVLPHLRRLSENHLLIAVDTALPAMIREAVYPDIVAAIDPQYWNTRHLDRCDENSEKTLILAESATHPGVFKRLKGRPWLTRTRFPLGTVLEDAAGIEGELKAGGSVATAAWDLAIYLGCDPITIGGLDLGFPGGRTHYAGSLLRERPHLFSHRTRPAENDFFDMLHDASPHMTHSASHGVLLTNARMDVYAAWFAESVRDASQKSLSRVGSEGRNIPGLTVIDIETLLARENGRIEIDRRLDAIRDTAVRENSRRRIQHALKLILDALAELEKQANRGKEWALRARRALDENRDPSKFLQELDKIDNDILSSDGRELVSFLLQPLIQRITSETDVGGKEALELSRKLYAAIGESASYHRKHLGKASSSGPTP